MPPGPFSRAHILLLGLFFILGTPVIAQEMYFPPLFGNTWETYSLDDMEWCQENVDSLYEFMERRNTKAFILLYKGKIVLEKYYDSFTLDSIWYWASAGKSLTAVITGIAQQEGFLSISDPTSDYLGSGWTNCDSGAEELITIQHQLSMTTGLDESVEDAYCTLDTCLNCIASPGTRWAYHNGPYTLLDGVITGATGISLNTYVIQKLSLRTGITGAFVPIDYNNVFFSTPRSMARFGLLMLNNAVWNGDSILTNPAYLDAMITSSQELNRSYGYLWWLNGQESFMIPGSQIVLPGPMFPSAPNDTYAALGRDGQFANIAPSDSIVWVRMGKSPGTGLISATLNDDIWQYINRLPCKSTATIDGPKPGIQFSLFPNPTSDEINIRLNEDLRFDAARIDVLSSYGEVLMSRTEAGPNWNLDSVASSSGNIFRQINSQ